jgi:hypothetical protein
MKKFKVTYKNSITGNSNSVVVGAQDLESATAQEVEMVQRMQKLSPHISLVSVVAA